MLESTVEGILLASCFERTWLAKMQGFAPTAFTARGIILRLIVLLLVMPDGYLG